MLTSAFVPFSPHRKFFIGGRGILNFTVYDKVGNVKAQLYSNNKTYILHIIYIYNLISTRLCCLYVYTCKGLRHHDMCMRITGKQNLYIHTYINSV